MSEDTERIYQVILHKKVKRQLKRLPKDLLQRIDKALSSLCRSPRPEGWIKISGFENIFRIRVGDWRIVYSIEDDMLVILVIEIAPRGKVYRDL